ncbi:MAG TPA: Rho termination factor N-terminal domain-containing protein [Miltoncostaeaceae bacterium]|nr:Rho termination factor N-terminal domain-containing protein [Miltoncostaeaceae bacterium]
MSSARPDHPGQWLLHHARTAIAELPENAGWLMRRYLTPASVDHAVDGARDGVRRVGDTVADAMPFGPDSLDLRLQRAREALEDARGAEEDALRRAREADDLAAREKAVVAEGRQRIQEAKRAGAAETRQRVADARAEAEADAARRVDEVAARNEAEREQAAQRAREARDAADEEMRAAQEQLAAARALADEAAEAARAAADDAHRRARAMSDQADATARAAEARAAEADGARDAVRDEAAGLVGDADSAPALEDIAGKTKPELVDLAASLGIDGRSGMTKDELVQAVRRASTRRRNAVAA